MCSSCMKKNLPVGTGENIFSNVSFLPYFFMLPLLDRSDFSINRFSSIETMEEKKRLTRSNDKMIAGVCGGIANYLGIDPTLVRIAYVLMVLFAGFGILLYVILWIVMPKSETV